MIHPIQKIVRGSLIFLPGFAFEVIFDIVDNIHITGFPELRPVGVGRRDELVFTSNATNLLAGMNGLEAGLGLILLTATGVYSLLYGTIEAAIVSLTMASCLFAFLFYNSYPAKFLPGDTLTYMIGVVFGTSIVIGNIEKFALIVFIPWFVEFLLKARKKFKASSLGVLQPDGTLKPKYKKIYSLTQIGMKLLKREKYIAPFFMLIETCLSILAFILTRLVI